MIYVSPFGKNDQRIIILPTRSRGLAYNATHCNQNHGKPSVLKTREVSVKECDFATAIIIRNPYVMLPVLRKVKDATIPPVHATINTR
jgi:hypothetical protein